MMLTPLTPLKPRSLRLLALAPLACLLLAGCRVSEHKNGDNKDVDIQTPFGSTSIKTNGKADVSAIGISPYPGAVPVKDHDSEDDSSNADINLSFGSFHLGVKAASFQTPDQPDKVLAFYRKDLARYGDVIECKGDTAVGQPTHTAQGLTCDTKQHNHISTHDHSGNDLELRAGSEQRQHIVGVEAKDGGTKIGLVALDLPSHLNGHESKDSE
jgi:hypothetical protein